MPVLPGSAFEADHHLTAQNNAFEFSSSAPTPPIRTIYHPPKS
jgi:hypothetical protein